MARLAASSCVAVRIGGARDPGPAPRACHCRQPRTRRREGRPEPLKALQEIASELLALDDRQLAVVLAADELVETCDDAGDA